MVKKINDIFAKVFLKIKELIKKYGGKAALGIFFFYLIRDVFLYIILPYGIYKIWPYLKELF